MRSDLIKIASLIFLILNCSYQVSTGQELIQAPAAIHISSTISEGKYSIPEIIEIARLNSIKVVILTDRDSMRWEYGLWPLRNMIKKTVESNSVFKYGIRRYLNEISQAQERNPDLVIIPGVESAPFYYWQGSPINSSLKMHNWHKHMLAIGLEDAEDYEYLPVIGNKKVLRLPFKLKDTYRLWPLLILLVGILFQSKKLFNYKDLADRSLGPYSRTWRTCGIVLIILGILFSLNNFPFREVMFDKYKGDLGIKPYQKFIDYVNQRGGSSFWAHPEAANIKKVGIVSTETQEHSQDLLESKGYSGFTIFYEGYKRVGQPGGIWDEVLKQYCQGKRKAPIWAIGGLCFDQTGELTNRIKALRTVFLVPELSKVAVLEALKMGRMYVMRGRESSQFVLDKFVVYDGFTNVYAIMGEQINLENNPRIEIGGQFLAGRKKPVKIKLIRNGNIIKTFEVNSPFDISFQDDYEGGERKFYYRVEIQSDGVFLVTNPIFVG